jgi:hypothetical protein
MRILKPLREFTDDIVLVRQEYFTALRALAKGPHFAKYGKNAQSMAEAYMVGFLRGLDSANEEPQTVKPGNHRRTQRKRS